ncbi:MAG: exonuclease domain-containing protein [Clostridium sp.]|nr:exonuclease domain-containing protein [Clostridium sp.]
MERLNKGKSLTNFVSDYTIIDIETTGLSPQYDDIIELAAIKVRNNKVIETYQQLINPGYLIGEYITDLTGITNEMLSGKPSLDNAIDSYINFLSDDILIGHNINFDVNFIYDNLLELRNITFSNSFIDTMRFARKLCKELKHHRLVDLIELFNIDVDYQHRALADCQTTHLIYNHLERIALEQYNSLDDFSDSFKRKSNYNYAKSSYKTLLEIQATTDEFDETHPLYDKVCVFTGTLEKYSRNDAAQIVVNYGGKIGAGITKKTNYLILGNNDYCKSIKDGKSSKQKKAEQYIQQGCDLMIITEDVFYDMLNTK